MPNVKIVILCILSKPVAEKKVEGKTRLIERTFIGKRSRPDDRRPWFQFGDTPG